MIHALSRPLRRFTEMRERYGLWIAVQTVVRRAISRVLPLDVASITWLDINDWQATTERYPGLSARLVSAPEVRRFARDPRLVLDARLAERLEHGHDFCVATLLDGRPIAYCWYAVGCLEGAHNLGVDISFGPEVAHGYNGFTLPEFRGKHLRGPLLDAAVHALSERGVRYLVGTVEWTNWASLRNCLRLGYRDIGWLWTFHPGARRWTRPPAAVRRLKLRYGREADLSSRRQFLAYSASAAIDVDGSAEDAMEVTGAVADSQEQWAAAEV